MAYESLIEEAKKYLTLDNSEFEKYYSKATENLQQNYKDAIASLNKQYSKDRNDAAAQAMLNSRNMNQYLAARGLSRSGESVQEKINSNLSLNNTLSGLADSNSRQILELAKNKNDSLLSLEEKRLERKDANDKWTSEQAFNIAKAENAKIEREEDIAREAQQIAEERAYQDSVRQDKYAHEMAVMEAEQAFKQRTAAEQREYEMAKILSQREYEDYIRNSERELEAEIRAEKARTEAEKAALEQQYKLEYYREQQRDKERLLQEEREYNASQKALEQQNKERLIAEEREYNAAQKVLEQKNKERLIAEEREYERQLQEAKALQAEINAAKEQENKIAYYQLQQADKERLIAEERAYNEMLAKQKAESSASAANSNDEKSDSKNDSGYTGKSIVQSVTGGKTKLTSTQENVAAYKALQNLAKNGVTPKQLTALEKELAGYGYTTPTDREINQVDVVKNAGDVYNQAYKSVEEQLAKQNIGSVAARPYALQSAEQAQLSYVREHTATTEAFYEICNLLNIDRNKAYRFLQSNK